MVWQEPGVLPGQPFPVPAGNPYPRKQMSEWIDISLLPYIEKRDDDGSSRMITTPSFYYMKP